MILAAEINSVLGSSILGFILGIMIGISAGYAYWGRPGRRKNG